MSQLIAKVQDQLKARRAAAVVEYRQILSRLNAPQDGDEVTLVEVLDILGRRPEDLEHDAEVMARAEQLRSLVRLLPGLTLSHARHENAQKLRRHRRNKAIAAANTAYEAAAEHLKTRFSPDLKRWAEAKAAEQALQALLPELVVIIGPEAAAEFRGLYSPEALSEAFKRAKEEMAAELGGEALDDTPPATAGPLPIRTAGPTTPPQSAVAAQARADFRASPALQADFNNNVEDYIKQRETLQALWEAEFEASPSLRAQFANNVGDYLAFRRAQDKRLIRA